MKAIFSIAFIMIVLKGFAQTPAETTVIKLSNKVFTWEMENKIDSIDNVFDEKFMAYTSGGQTQPKQQYMAVFKSGNITHNSIEVEENTATVINNTATVAGKGKFTITVGGNKKTIHLSYLEVFIRTDEKSSWKMLALHAGLLQN